MSGLLDQLQALGATASPSTLLPQHFIRVERGLQAVLAAGHVSSGTAAVQDEAAGLVVRLLDPQPGEKVLDCCAAPGGKTLFAATCMQGKVRGLRGAWRGFLGGQGVLQARWGCKGAGRGRG